jgi:hypothetical protein
LIGQCRCDQPPGTSLCGTAGADAIASGTARRKRTNADHIITIR